MNPIFEGFEVTDIKKMLKNLLENFKKEDLFHRIVISWKGLCNDRNEYPVTEKGIG